MRDKKRIDKMLEVIEKTWKKYPDLRFGQLILNVSTDPALYYMEDDEFLRLFKSAYEAVSEKAN